MNHSLSSPKRQEPYFRFWPKGLPLTTHVPDITLYENLRTSAQRFPKKPATIFFDTMLTYSELLNEVDALAGFLQKKCNVSKGDRVALLSQSCPQFIIAYYAILRANAVVVPINAMSTRDDIEYYRQDSGARTLIAAQELLANSDELEFDYRISFNYADYLRVPTDLPTPVWIAQHQKRRSTGTIMDWNAALAQQYTPGPLLVQPDDLCVLPYTSGTTGKPKGCMHTHHSMMTAIWAAGLWRQLHAETVFLGIAPMFHMLGMQNGMNLPLLLGATVIIAPRWDRTMAAMCIERYRVSAWTAPTAALVDFFANPDINQYDLSSITLLTGGGGPAPEAVVQQIKTRFGIMINEAYGMSETASFMFCNPLTHQKAQCLGIPTFGVSAKIINPDTLDELPDGEVGEIVACGEQIMQGYWNNPQGNAESFLEIDGKRYLRTGDIGRIDNEGFFFMTDRLKRMINVSGFKVWPAEVETLLFEHPAVLEACVIGVPDHKQGESVKAFISLRQEAKGHVTDTDIIQWARKRMAVYKAPRHVTFIDQFPRASSGKILWRELS